MDKLIKSTTKDAIPMRAYDRAEFAGKDGLSVGVNGKVEFVSANGLDAWHSLGQVCEGALTLEEAMQYSGLDQWTVIKEPLYNAQGVAQPIYGLYRSDSGLFLASCGERMIPRQPKDHFRFLDALVQSENDLKFDTAGALDEGRIIFCSINLGSFELFGEDKSNTYVAGLLSYDGRLAMQYFLTVTRVVCRNTMKQALRNQGSVIKVRQTSGAEQRLQAAQVFFADALRDMETFKNTMEKFSRYVLKEDVYKALVDEMVPSESTRGKNIQEMIRDCYLDDILYTKQLAGSAYTGTMYNFFNAITEYTDHKRSVHGENKEYARATSAIVGKGSDFKDRAFKLMQECVLV